MICVLVVVFFFIVTNFSVCYSEPFDAEELINRLNCTLAVTTDQCSTGYIQELADTLANSGETELANSVVKRCALKNNGESCLTVTRRSVEQIRNVAEICGSILTQKVCPPGCQAALQEINKVMGCCVSNILNDGFHLFSDFNIDIGLIYDFNKILELQSSSISTWTMCGVEQESVCTNTKMYNSTIAGTPRIISEIDTIIDYQCTSPHTQSAVNVYNTTDSCRASYQFYFLNAAGLVGACGIRNGSFCINELSFDANFFTTSIIEFNCRQLFTNSSLNSTLPCPEDCRNSLLNVARDVGCCANSQFNGTGTEIERGLSFELWDHCGVPTLPFCPSSLSLTPSSSTKETFQWSFLIILCFVSSL